MSPIVKEPVTRKSSSDALDPLVIVSQPGRERDSLAAVLRTLPGLDLFQLDPEALCSGEHMPPVAPRLVLVDLVSLGAAGAETLAMVRRQWPQARILALVENGRAARRPLPHADRTLPRCLPAGQLLSAVAAMG